MKEKLLFIPIEVKPREFHSRLLLAHFAIQQDFTVIIGEYSQVVHKAIECATGIFIDKCLSSSKYNIAKKLSESSIKIVSLDEEGLCHHNNEYLFKNFRSDKKSFQIAEKVFCWGVCDALKLKKQYPEIKKKFIVTGNPRIDLCDRKFWNLSEEKTKNEGNKKYVLIISNFSINNANGFGFSSKQLKSYGLFDDQGFKQDFDLRKRFRYLTFLEFSLAIERLIADNPSVNFVLRPHPSENINYWHDFLSSYSNCKVIYDHEYYYWLRNACVVVHSSCTSGIFTYFMQIPTITYLPLPDDPYADFIANDLGYKTFNYCQLNNTLRILMSKDRDSTTISDTIIKKLDIFVSNLKNKTSAERIIDELCTINIDYDKANFNQPTASKFSLLKVFLKIAQIADIRLSKKQEENLFIKDYGLGYSTTYCEQQFSSISMNEIQACLEKISLILNFQSPQIKELHNNLFIIKKS
ncbi:MAG: surface carbohydrate biosynthesis protein [Saprospiraceae bacterium]